MNCGGDEEFQILRGVYPEILRPAQDDRRRAQDDRKSLVYGLWSVVYGLRGFTLVELLIAVTLFALVAAGSSGIFGQGIAIWKRSKMRMAGEYKALIALEKMGADTRQALRPNKDNQQDKFAREELEYEGNSGSFSLPGVVSGFTRDGKESVQYGRIQYQWNASKKTILRCTESASDIFLKRPPACREIAGAIPRAQFRYYVYTGLEDSYSWYEDWDSRKGLPKMIEINLEVENKTLVAGASLARKKYKRIFPLPVGGKIV